MAIVFFLGGGAVLSGRHREFFNQVSEFNHGRIVFYMDCELSFREIGQGVLRDQATLMRICHRWMQEKTTNRYHPPHCATALDDDKRIMSMTVMDRPAIS
ncbi:uncharacterized protein TNCV_4137631 [Trichonephila clavipes]|nr:uncharacterized protein TNCV_4137631 [Trichonephila clavipes]